jgi:hypothetical protein
MPLQHPFPKRPEQQVARYREYFRLVQSEFNILGRINSPVLSRLCCFKEGLFFIIHLTPSFIKGSVLNIRSGLIQVRV